MSALEIYIKNKEIESQRLKMFCEKFVHGTLAYGGSVVIICHQYMLSYKCGTDVFIPLSHLRLALSM